MAKSNKNVWSAGDVEAYYARQGKTMPPEAQDALRSLRALGLESHMRPPEMGEAKNEAVELLKGKRKSKKKTEDVNAVVASMNSPLVYAHATQGAEATLSFWFDGARLLTVNQLISILEKHWRAIIPYRKACKNMVARALAGLPGPAPFFDGPTRVIFYRRGKKSVDLDALPTMFKYVTDSLREHGVISDDNPEIVVDIRTLQEQGMPALGIRLEKLSGWQKEDLTQLKQAWLGQLSLPPKTTD